MAPLATVGLSGGSVFLIAYFLILRQHSARMSPISVVQNDALIILALLKKCELGLQRSNGEILFFLFLSITETVEAGSFLELHIWICCCCAI